MAMTDDVPVHLRGNGAPVSEERTLTNLKVIGKLPAELDGRYLRNGANPISGMSEHPFFGDGMIHGIRLRDGKAEWYRNRYVRTPFFNDPSLNILDPAVMLDMKSSKANTHIVGHAGQILALEEGHFPYVLDGNLETIGATDYQGRLKGPFTAHPKICPTTGEMLAFGYSFLEPYLTYLRVSARGELLQVEPITVNGPTMMHDFNVTQNHVIFMDLPAVFSLERAMNGDMPIAWDDNYPSRLGVMPRNGNDSQVKWYDIDPCYVFHPVNAHDDGDNIVLHVSRQPEAFGRHSDDYAEVGRLWKWTIDTKRGKVTEELVDDRPGDFGRVDDRRVGLPARYGYLMALAGEGNAEEPVYGSALWKYDLTTGACVEHHLGDGVRGSEPVFAPAGPDASEDEGWVITIVHDTGTNRSKLIIVDARDFSAPPVATVHLPQRAPYGAHGSWIPSTSIATS